MFEKRLILDTCALLWLAKGGTELSDNARSTIEHASIVFVSAISAWEISLKTARGGLDLPLSPEQWFTGVIENHHLTVASLDLPVLFEANNLPWHHNDPADRFIIATALHERAAVVTADRRFSSYGVKTIR